MGKKVVIAGGRDYVFTWLDYMRLDRLAGEMGPFEEVVSGGATGADACGEKWAKIRGIKIRRFLPDWASHGRRAGPLRNAQMAAYAAPDGVCVLFPGGRGTKSMHEQAARAGLTIVDLCPK